MPIAKGIAPKWNRILLELLTRFDLRLKVLNRSLLRRRSAVERTRERAVFTFPKVDGLSHEAGKRRALRSAGRAARFCSTAFQDQIPGDDDGVRFVARI